MKRRIRFNDLKDEFLAAAAPVPPPPEGGGGGGGIEGSPPPFGEQGPPNLGAGARSLTRSGPPMPSLRANGGGSSDPSANKMPPKDGKDYKKAVKASDDGSDLFIDICIPKDFKLDRAKDSRRQQIVPQDMWKEGKVDLFGSNDPKSGEPVATAQGGPYFRLDPYQVPINFGPDALAVEFFDGEGPAKEQNPA